MMVVEMTYNLQRDNYSDFIIKLRKTLAAHGGERETVGNNPVLPEQRSGKQPARWIHITLVAETKVGLRRITVAVRDDNLYLIGFRNDRGDWYEFGYSAYSKRMLPVEYESTFLECDVDYTSILGGARELKKLDLGLGIITDAVCRLSGHGEGIDGTGRASYEDKYDLARLILTFCEATRMTPHYTRVQDGMRAHKMCKNINNDEVNYLLRWGDTSEALLRWNEGQDNWPDHLRNIGIAGSGRALQIVYLLLKRPTKGEPKWMRRNRKIAAGDHGRSEEQSPFKRSKTHHQQSSGQVHDQLHQQPQQQQEQPNADRNRSRSEKDKIPPAAGGDHYECHGRTLLEVFAVRALGFHLVGTIAVFDGKRGQIIYDNRAAKDNSPSSSGGDEVLLLTGPYTGISAYASFTIEVEIPVPNTPGISSDVGSSQKKKSSDVGELNWDCYNDDNEYDVLISKTIKTNSGRQVEVTYAVLSEAVEAKVEVRVDLPGATSETRVYGKITACSEYFGSEDKARSELFNSDVGEAVTDNSGKIAPLPLARSVVAMRVGYSLLMDATLYDRAAPSTAGPILQSQQIKLTLGGETTILSTNNGGVVEVKITSPDCRRPAMPTLTSPAPSCAEFVCPASRGGF